MPLAYARDVSSRLKLKAHLFQQ